MPLMQKKNTKLYLTFSEETYTLLERWGKAVSRPLTNLGVYIIEQAIRQALADGTIPLVDPPPLHQSGVGQSALSKLIDGEPLTSEEEAAIAEACNRSPTQVRDAAKKLRKER